FEQNTAQA
uniref:Tumor-associated antigen MUT2 n=1 Tax=Mus musculus TaxID=10090 RepID=Q7M066_MOUSE